MRHLLISTGLAILLALMPCTAVAADDNESSRPQNEPSTGSSSDTAKHTTILVAAGVGIAILIALFGSRRKPGRAAGTGNG